MNTLRYSILACLVAIGITASAQQSFIPEEGKNYNASLFGIKSNGTTLNTRSIQAAIDYISANGGGNLVFKVGRYLTGSIYLKSNVTIVLSNGAVLAGSVNPYDYDFTRGYYALVFAFDQENIGIVGGGTIDGNGRELANNFLDLTDKGLIKDANPRSFHHLGRATNRPHLIYFRQCKNVEIKGITERNSACWTQTTDQCENLEIDHVTLISRAYWNNDGMDIVDCNGVKVTNCYIDATDDGICLKSHDSKSVCQNIEAYHNTVISSASGIKFGTLGAGGFKHVRMVGNTVRNTFRSAIAIESVDGGICEDIIIDSLRSYNTGNPIYLVVGDRRKGINGRHSTMHDVTIRNLYAEVPAGKPDLGLEFEGPTAEDGPRNVSPCGIVGLPNEPIRNVTIENVEIVFPGGGNEHYAKVGLNELDKVPEMPTAYPEFSQFKELPAWGFFLRHVEGVTFRNVKLTATARDYRPAIVLHDVHQAEFDQVKATSPKLKATIFQYKSTNIKK